MSYNPESTFEKRKKLAWSIATTTCAQTKKDLVTIYNKLMEEFDQNDKQSKCESLGSCKLQECVTAKEDCSP